MIVFYLSGGTGNLKTNKSLGGLPSNQFVPDGLNNLFAKVPKELASIGGDVYRCIYLVNSNTYSNEITISSPENEENLSYLTVGISLANEIQNLRIFGDVFGGEFVLKYTALVNGILVTQTTWDIVWMDTIEETATNIQNALNALTYLGGVEVTAQQGELNYLFSIEFAGDDENESHRLLEVEDFSLFGGSITYSMTSFQKGSPINSIATTIGFENQPPFGVSFSTSTEPITLSPDDYLALWIKRTTPARTASTSEDTDTGVISIASTLRT